MKFKDIIKSPRIIALVAAGIILIVYIIAIISPKKTQSGTTGREGYTAVYAVPGVTFEVKQSLADYATSVLEVSKDVDFVQNASYTYKNGTDTYMLFNMSQYVVIAKKGTTFDFANTKPADSLKKNSLNSIWFSNPSGLNKDGNKCTLEVTAQVVITNTIYNDFYGKLTTVTEGEDEWALFVGSTNKEDESMNTMINNVISSFSHDSSNAGDAPQIFAVSVDNSSEIIEVKLVETTKDEPEPEPEEEPIDIPSAEDVVSDVPEEGEASVAEPVEEIVPEPVTEEPEEPIEEVKEEPEVVAPVEEEPKEALDENVETVTASYNQMVPQYEDSKAYTSSVYSMLAPGQTGYMTAVEQSLGVTTEIFVRLDSVNDEKTTNALISEYIKSGDAYYTEMEAPLGTHWESVTYSVKADNVNEFYIDTKLIGFDGDKLKYRGIAYSKKTYDILNRTTTNNGWTTGYVSFYAVPNGCKEYAVMFGTDNDGAKYSAYYKVD